jgi:hypothetical protein
MDFKDEIPTYGFLFINGLKLGSPNKRWLEEITSALSHTLWERDKKDHLVYSHPRPQFARRLGSAMQLLDRSTAAWASLKRSPCEVGRLPSHRGVATKAMSWRCLNEVGEVKRLNRKLWEIPFMGDFRTFLVFGGV